MLILQYFLRSCRLPPEVRLMFDLCRAITFGSRYAEPSIRAAVTPILSRVEPISCPALVKSVKATSMTEQFSWHNAPPVWEGDEKSLSFETAGATDFWRKTFYGFTRDSGHAFLRPISGDFSASAKFVGSYETLYDQAGLFLRLDEAHWVKAGIEYTDGMMHFSVVVTRETSDWSVIPLPDAQRTDEVAVRLSRHGDAVRVQFSIAGAPWQLARLSSFSDQDAEVGVMACSPERAGFRASFREVTVGPAIGRDLHSS